MRHSRTLLSEQPVGRLDEYPRKPTNTLCIGNATTSSVNERAFLKLASMLTVGSISFPRRHQFVFSRMV